MIDLKDISLQEWKLLQLKLPQELQQLQKMPALKFHLFPALQQFVASKKDSLKW